MCVDHGKLLYSGYQYGNASLDLYGLRACEDHGYIVTTATLMNTSLNLSYVLDDDALDDMGAWLDAYYGQAYRASHGEARAERAAHDREMAQLDHLWRSL